MKRTGLMKVWRVVRMIYVLYSPSFESRESQSQAARSLLRQGLEEEFGIRGEPDLIFNSFGKPSLARYREIHISIAHCKGAIAVALSSLPVGIDIEKIRKFEPYAAGRILGTRELEDLAARGDSERAFFSYWTLKESYVKALGCGLSYPMKKLELRFGEDGCIASNKPGAAFELQESEDGFLIATCHLRNHDSFKGK